MNEPITTPAALIDCHAHLDDAQFDKDRDVGLLHKRLRRVVRRSLMITTLTRAGGAGSVREGPREYRLRIRRYTFRPQTAEHRLQTAASASRLPGRASCEGTVSIHDT